MELWFVVGVFDTNSKEFSNVYGNVWYDGKSYTVGYSKKFIEPPSVAANALFNGGIGGISVSKTYTDGFEFFIYHTREYTFNTTVKVNYIAMRLLEIKERKWEVWLLK